MTLTQMEYALTLSKTKHFQKAAQLCHVSQPTLSMQLKKLEETIGVIIFDRSRSPLLITEEGQKILNQIRVILSETKKLKTLAEQTYESISGELNFGIIPTMSSYILPVFLAEMQKEYPKIRLKVEELQTNTIIERLLNDELDAGILATPLRHDQIIERHLFMESFYVLHSQGHELSRKKYVSPKDLKSEDIIVLEDGHCLRNQALNVCKIKADKKNKLLDLKSGNLETLIRIVINGKGYTILPELALNSLSKENRSKLIKPFTSPTPTREVSIVHSRSFYKEKQIDALEKVILKNLPKEVRSYKTRKYSVIEIT